MAGRGGVGRGRGAIVLTLGRWNSAVVSSGREQKLGLGGSASSICSSAELVVDGEGGYRSVLAPREVIVLDRASCWLKELTLDVWRFRDEVCRSAVEKV